MAVSKKEAMMRKVRGLLAKAEDPSCTPEEQELFSEKASELIAQYAIDVAMLGEKRKSNRGKPTTRRVPVDKNYTTPRALIIQAVAKAFGCRMLLDTDKHVVLVGFEADLDMVETLANSLLLQAANGMLHESRRTGRGGTDLWRFRQDFLLGFAHRAGIRLREQYQEQVDKTPGAGLVLRDRSAEVEDEFKRLFPQTKSGRVSTGHSGGYGSGIAAANRADIGGQRFAGGRAAIA